MRNLLTFLLLFAGSFKLFAQNSCYTHILSVNGNHAFCSSSGIDLFGAVPLSATGHLQWYVDSANTGQYRLIPGATDSFYHGNTGGNYRLNYWDSARHCNARDTFQTYRRETPRATLLFRANQNPCERYDSLYVDLNGTYATRVELYYRASPDSAFRLKSTSYGDNRYPATSAGDYRVVAYNSQCPSDSSNIVHVNARTGSTAPNAGITGRQNHCGHDVIDLCPTQPNQTGCTYTWTHFGATVAADLLHCIHTTEDSTFVLTVTNASGCSASSSVNLYESARTPLVYSSAEFCQNGSTYPLDSVVYGYGGTLKWYTAATGGTGSTTEPVVSTQTVGSTSYYVSQTSGGCESDRAEVVVNVNARPSATLRFVPNNAPCATYDSLAADVTGTYSSIDWYYRASPDSAFTRYFTSYGGYTYFSVSRAGDYRVIAYGPCTSDSSNIVHVNAHTGGGIPNSDISGNGYRCIHDTVTFCPVQPNQSGCTYAWTYLGSPVAAGPDHCIHVTEDSIYTLTVTNASGCSSSSSVAVRDATPAPHVYTTPITYCQNGTSASLAGDVYHYGDLLWYATATSTVSSTTAPVPSTIATGTFRYYVSQTYNGCEGPRSEIVVIVNPAPPAPTGVNKSVCLNATVYLETGDTNNYAVNWYDSANGHTPIYPYQYLSDSGHHYFWGAYYSSSCGEGPRRMVDIYVYPQTHFPITGDTAVEPGGTLMLSINTLLPDSASWYIRDKNGYYYGYYPGRQNLVVANIRDSAATVEVSTRDAHGCYAHEMVNLNISRKVWPGDANEDFVVNSQDALQLAVYSGRTGRTRPNATIAWQGQFANDWSAPLATMVNGYNLKYADCNGDGTVSVLDLQAVNQNYSLTHQRSSGAHPAQRLTGAPELYFDLSQVSLVPGNTVSVPIKLGKSANPMQTLLGLSTLIRVDGITLNSAPVITYTPSWLSSGATMIQFAKAPTTNTVDWAYGRTNSTNVSGSGTIAYLTFTIPASAAGQDLRLSFDRVLMVDNGGVTKTDYDVVDDSATVLNSTVVTDYGNNAVAAIVPNPSHGAASIRYTATADGQVTISVVSLSGQQVWNGRSAVTRGFQQISLPENGVAAGVYQVSLTDENGQVIARLKWLKD